MPINFLKKNEVNFSLYKFFLSNRNIFNKYFVDCHGETKPYWELKTREAHATMISFSSMLEFDIWQKDFFSSTWSSKNFAEQVESGNFDNLQSGSVAKAILHVNVAD